MVVPTETEWNGKTCATVRPPYFIFLFFLLFKISVRAPADPQFFAYRIMANVAYTEHFNQS